MRGFSIIVFTLLSLSCLPASLAQNPVMVVESWSEEFCRPSLCGLMSSDQYVKCCRLHNQCCAYAELLHPKGPFSFEEESDELDIVSPYNDDSSPEDHSPHQPSVLSPPNAADQPPRFERLRATPTPQQAAQIQPRPRPRPNYRPLPSYSQLMDQPRNQPQRTFNEVVEEENVKVCRPRFCSLLESKKQQMCCHVYKQCCAYAHLNRYSDPFSFEKSPYP